MYVITHYAPKLPALANPKIRKDLYISNENKSPFNTKYYYSSFTTFMSCLTKLHINNLIGNSFIRKFVENSYTS